MFRRRDIVKCTISTPRYAFVSAHCKVHHILTPIHVCIRGTHARTSTMLGITAREDVLFDHNDHHEHGEEDEPSSDNQRFTMEQKTLSTTDTTTMTCRAEAVQWSKERCLSSLSAEKEARGSQHNMEVEPFSRQPTLVGPSVGVIGQLNNIWATGGALLACLSTSAQALLTDDSKAVRSKALVCCLRILETYGRYISTSRDILSNDPCPTSGWTEQLAAVSYVSAVVV